jgi:hypothetical protein
MQQIVWALVALAFPVGAGVPVGEQPGFPSKVTEVKPELKLMQKPGTDVDVDPPVHVVFE